MKKVSTPFLFILGLLVIWGTSLLAVNKFSSKFIINRTSYEIDGTIPLQLRSTVLPWLNFDGRNYYDIALHGYHERSGQNLRVFFPVYPGLIGSLRLIGINSIFSGLFISFFCLTLSLWLLYRYSGSLNAILLLVLSPAAFFFISYYTESLFLLMVLAFFICLKKEKYAPATLIAILASITKVVGISLPIILLVSALRLGKKRFPKITLLSFAGIIGLMIYFLYTTGDPLIFIRSQASFGRPIGLLSPITAFTDWIQKVILGPQSAYDSPYVYPIILLELISGIFLVIFLFKTFSKIPKPEWWYLLLSFLPMLFSGSLSSTPRYLLVMFPIFIYLSKKLTAVQYGLVCVIFFVIQIFLAALFLRGYWVS